MGLGPERHDRFKASEGYHSSREELHLSLDIDVDYGYIQLCSSKFL